MNFLPNDYALKNKMLCLVNRSNRQVIKVLEIDDTGIWVYYKRTHVDKFLWPKKMDSQLIDQRQLLWLLDGLDVIQKSAHKPQKYSY